MKLCVIWSLHQPSGWHATQRQFTLPWTRIHTARHFLPFLRLTDEFPEVPLTLSVSPVVLRQLEQTTLKAVSESMLEVHRKAAPDLRPAEIADLVGLAFSATPESLARPFPRWHSLWSRWKAWRGIDSRLIATLSREEIQDLQVLVQLGWLGDALQQRVPDLLAKARDGAAFLPEDAERLADLQLEAMLECLQLLRARTRSGGIEALGSPLHRAVLPLLSGEVEGYCYPEDARTQLMRGLRVQYLNYGARPLVMHLPEGALSEQSVAPLLRSGVAWAVASSRVLAESLGRTPTESELGSCWEREGIGLVFSDSGLENQLRFVYPHLNAEQALDDFKRRVECAARACMAPDALLTVEVDVAAAGPLDLAERKAFWRGILSILSGEYGNARLPLRGATLRDALPSVPRRPLTMLPGSSRRTRGFACWSEAEKPFYWKALKYSRERFQNVRAWKTLVPERLVDAKASILALESVEWTDAMEPGLDAFTQRKTEELFRAHLDCLVRSLGLPRPMWFTDTLLPRVVTVTSIAPSQPITPALDGRASSYHSWIGSGFFREREEGGRPRDAMQQLNGVYFGADDVSAYLRVALPGPSREMLRQFEIQGVLHPRDEEQIVSWFRIVLTPGGDTNLDVRLAVPVVARESEKPAAAIDDVADLRLPLSGLGVRLGEMLRFQVSLWEHGSAVASAPTLGWEEFRVADRVTYESDAITGEDSGG